MDPTPPTLPDPMVLVNASGASSLLHEREVVRAAGRQAISAFLDAHTCFSVLRASGKVVVFDTRIPVQFAFYALVEHDMQAAPLWDPNLCLFVGLLTVTDFIDILRYYRRSKLDVSALASRSIADILGDENIINIVLTKRKVEQGAFLAADASATLKHACRLLHNNSLDFLPIVLPNDMRALACITYTNILEHLVTNFREQRRLFDDTVFDLGIGTYHDKVVTATPNQSLEDALEILHKHSLGALPVVDPVTRRILGVYSRSDITFLATASDAEDAIGNLDLKLEVVMGQRRTDVTTPDALHTCTKGHTLQSIFEYFAQIRFNRLYVVDEEERVVGVVSARDLVAYFLTEDSTKEKQGSGK
mmetsp:Transcript_910/g.1287  ORF Transcript_910/g.1287 Transcript_910/m.1287 type:complete len:361 (+) Transcript_910:43-1125(+)|eukprot:CAMPEP_0118688292 /NCGR_PEP_ID=MMETSP0800-20121206/8841_1 /TAXON_ID=210618 ORGANISM="Striatella unipunctata, Strain CCMP2910" /NCGR_SAMPLE_ID=MMETSP0800 /ASSEMBLY_ACC=CAM_ASM_000638 /LENGTH=360 /DNA_ID=CAMNT_0006585539 /DNA_START=40 /DNA_END=1122 /DNA_ORIENTATION=-